MSEQYYDENFESFISDTINVDMEEHYRKFLSRLTDRASILDAGCGSGRDSLAFKNLGYKVMAFDASSAMVEATKSLAEVPAYQTTFQSAKFETLFNGIWACASLLHVPRQELSKAFENLAAHLKNDGIIYLSLIHISEPTRPY